MKSKFAIERKKRGLTKKTLYNACNLSAQTWQKLEDFPKDFKISELEIISIYFKCSIIELLEIVCTSEALISNNNKDIISENIEDIRDILQRENLTWRAFSRNTNDEGQSNLKRNLEQWIKKINQKVNIIGYKLTFKRKDE